MSTFEIPDNWQWIEAGGVRFAAPPEWTTISPDGAIVAAMEPRADEAAFLANVNAVNGTPVVSGEAAEDIAASDFEAMTNTLVELQAIDTELLTLQERDWARTLMAYRGATHPLTLEQRTTIVGDRSIVVSATVDTNEWPAQELTLTTILDSVTILEEAGVDDQ
jgi:hypothetical protein